MKRGIFISYPHSWNTAKATFREKHTAYGYGSFAIKRLIINEHSTYTKKFNENKRINPNKVGKG